MKGKVTRRKRHLLGNLGRQIIKHRFLVTLCFPGKLLLPTQTSGTNCTLLVDYLKLPLNIDFCWVPLLDLLIISIFHKKGYLILSTPLF